MRTEFPADRLHRRLGGATDSGDDAAADGAADGADDPRALLPRWLPDAEPRRGLRGWLATARADPGRAGAIGLAVVAAFAVLVTVFTLMRDDPSPVVSAKLPPVEMAAGRTSSTAPSSTAAPGAAPSGLPDQPVVVSVVGLVKSPGLVTVAPGARVADAISAAGGPLGGADTIGLNMARHINDGEQVVVGIAPLPGQPPVLGSSIGPANVTESPSAGTESGSTAAGPLDLNSATAEQLDALPGVGPVTAAAIVAWREQHGSFDSVDQLGEVDGIGPARLAKLRDLVRV